MVEDTISLVHKKKNQIIKKVKWEEITSALRTIIDTQRLTTKKCKYKVIYGIPRGGMVVAVALSYMLNIPVIEKFEPKIAKEILVTDDIVDSGATLKAMKTMYPNTDFLSIYVKEKAKKRPDYYYLTIQEKYWLKFPYEC
jgi:hypoxanthine phosphoribosyltransferase